MSKFKIDEMILRSFEISSVKTLEDNMFDLVLRGYDQEVRARIMKGESANLRNDSDQTLLHYAILYKQVKIAKFLLETGAYLDAKDKFGQTPRDLINKDNSGLYNQAAEGINSFLLQTEQENVAKDLLGSSEDNNFCNIC